MQAKGGKLTKPILDDVPHVMHHIGQSEGYSLILKRGEAGVVYIPSDLRPHRCLNPGAPNSGEGREEEPKPAAPGEGRRTGEAGTIPAPAPKK